MTRLRTHNKRAKRLPYAVFARKRHQAWKTLQYARMYGMGTRGIREMAQMMARFTHELDLTRETVDRFRDAYGTVTGRLKSKGPDPMYQLPKTLRLPRQDGPFIATNFAEQEARALVHHRAFLDAARARGDTVIEHTYADATILVKGDK